MSLFSRIAGAREGRPVSPETLDKIRVNPQSVQGPDIRLEDAEDLQYVLTLCRVIQDKGDEARETVRKMSARERAVFGFYLRETERLVEEEDAFRTQADRAQAREGHPDFGC